MAGSAAGQHFKLFKQGITQLMELVECLAILVSSLLGQKFRSQLVYLLVQRLDGVVCRLFAVANPAVVVQPGAEAALMVIQCRRCFTLTPEVGLDGQYPCAVFDPGIQYGDVVAADGGQVGPGGGGLPAE